MTLHDEFKKFSPADFALIVCIFLSIFAPGFLTLYLYKPTLIQTLDTSKVLLFSLSLALPLFAINTIILMLSSKETTPYSLKEISFLGGIIAIFSFYPSLLIAFFQKLPFSDFLITLTILELLWLALFSIAYNLGKL